MDISSFENSYWSGNDGLYYKIYSLEKHVKEIAGFIRKCSENTLVEMDIPNDFQYVFKVHTKEPCTVVSNLFLNNSQIPFTISVSPLQIEMSIDNISQLILTRMKSPDQ